MRSYQIAFFSKDYILVINYDGVFDGTRPKLPTQSMIWMIDLVDRCWHKDPCQRFSFDKIIENIELKYELSFDVMK